MRVRVNFIAVLAALGAAGAAMAAVAVAQPLQADAPPAESKVVQRPGERFMSAIEAQQEFDRLSAGYHRLADQAQDVGVDAEPMPDEVTSNELADRVDKLREQVREAGEEDFGAVEGVSIDTLNAIAACESGGDPTAVSSDGTYRGKYQFDEGTWASVGGSGDPAAAPEAEQDYRAALLYQQAGTSPWPICGQ